MKQRFLANSVLFLLACLGAYGQVGMPTPSPNTPRDALQVFSSKIMQWHYTAIKEYMRYPSPLSPIGDGVVAMMGDEAAFHLFTIMINRPPLTAVQTLTVLDIIHNSFKQPGVIQNIADRKPRQTLALLKYIQATAVDQRVKERIATEMTFLATVPQTITPPPLPLLPAQPGVMPTR